MPDNRELFNFKFLTGQRFTSLSFLPAFGEYYSLLFKAYWHIF